MAIISDNVVRMANLCVAGSHAVNGVSRLHSEILKDTVFHDFYTVTPEKFKNVTNGIAHRRWLCQANPELTEYLTKLIGGDFATDASALTKLNAYAGDPKVLDRLGEIKLNNKKKFAEYVLKNNGVEINPESIFDVQVKRLHEYKRQHLNALHILAQYKYVKEHPEADFRAAHVSLCRKGGVRLLYGQKDHKSDLRDRKYDKQRQVDKRQDQGGIP